MTKSIVSEYEEQVALVKRCHLEGIEIIAIENSLQFPIQAVLDIVKPYVDERELKNIQMRLNKLMAMLVNKKLKAGMKRGMTDLFFPQLKLFIELKRRDGGVVSKEQSECHKMLRECGFTVEVAYGAKEAWEVIKNLINNS
jgi:hypothetical protein